MEEMSRIVLGGYLEHHGIKGQKWGRRRYQNEDGTLTELGKSHDQATRHGTNHYAPSGAYSQAAAQTAHHSGRIEQTNFIKDARLSARGAAAKLKTKKANHEFVSNLINQTNPDYVLSGSFVNDIKKDYEANPEAYGVSQEDWDQQVAVIEEAIEDWKEDVEKKKKRKGISREEMRKNKQIVKFKMEHKKELAAQKEQAARQKAEKFKREHQNSGGYAPSTPMIRHDAMMYNIVFDDHISHDGILNMKWGRRRYQNPDGTLTELGKARLKAKRDAEKTKDPMKYASMDDRARIRYDQNLNKAFDENDRDIANKYAKEWATQDTEKMKKVAEAGSEAIRKMEQMERETRPTPPPAKRMDLKNMTDQELRDRINRENLERQYNQYFNQQPPARISKGRQAVQTALAVGGTVMATASTALGIALAIKQLKES